jgi:phage gpG-like protein
MARYKDIDDFMSRLNEKTRRVVPQVVAETATEFFKERFRVKQDPDGRPWQPVKRPVKRGSLMVRSGKLMNTIRPSLVRPDRVRISAGNAKAPYARIHNEGGTIKHPGGTAYIPGDKRFAWVKNKTAARLEASGRKLPRTKPHDINIPQRRFMGHSKQLNGRIITRIKGLMGDI